MNIIQLPGKSLPSARQCFPSASQYIFCIEDTPHASKTLTLYVQDLAQAVKKFGTGSIPSGGRIVATHRSNLVGFKLQCDAFSSLEQMSLQLSNSQLGMMI